MYKIDMHVHTSEVSACGNVSAKTLIPLYKKHGYDGIVITDHFYQAYFDRLGQINWKEKVATFLHGYELAREDGEKMGLDVFAGMEIRFDNCANDYLVFGVNYEFVEAHQNLCAMTLKEFKDLAQKVGLLIFQAHPFRAGMSIAAPELLDGVEIYNGNQRHNSHDDLAYDYAKKHNLGMSAGSDFHELEDIAMGATFLHRRPVSNIDLVNILREKTVSKFIMAGLINKQSMD